MSEVTPVSTGQRLGKHSVDKAAPSADGINRNRFCSNCMICNGN